MRTALKEWAVVDEALGSGQQIILLRKGGIHEAHAKFEVEHESFLIYPTYLHQAAELVKPVFQARCRDDRTDKRRVLIRHMAQVVEVFAAPPTPETADRWDEFHVYARQLIDKRYQYKPERPLHILLVRVHRLARPVEIEETADYAGCRSWVTLDDPVDVAEAAVVLDNDTFAEQADRLRRSLSSNT